MRKQYPKDMVALATNPAAKLILFSDLPQAHVTDCVNCGGMGFFNVFVALDGPFQEPTFPYNGSAEDHKTSHWYNGGWWAGKSYNFDCPVCKNQGRYKIMSEQEAVSRGVPVHDPRTMEIVR